MAKKFEQTLIEKDRQITYVHEKNAQNYFTQGITI